MLSMRRKPKKSRPRSGSKKKALKAPRIEFKTLDDRMEPLETGWWSLLRKGYLRRLGISASDISTSSLTLRSYLPGDLYWVSGIALSGHLCGGSVDWDVVTTSGNAYSFQDVFYYDENLRRSHHGGLPHWNHEARYRLSGDTDWTYWRDPPHHIIGDSRFLDLTTHQPDGTTENYTIDRTKKRT